MTAACAPPGHAHEHEKCRWNGRFSDHAHNERQAGTGAVRRISLCIRRESRGVGKRRVSKKLLRLCSREALRDCEAGAAGGVLCWCRQRGVACRPLQLGRFGLCFLGPLQDPFAGRGGRIHHGPGVRGPVLVVSGQHHAPAAPDEGSIRDPPELRWRAAVSMEEYFMAWVRYSSRPGACGPPAGYGQAVGTSLFAS